MNDDSSVVLKSTNAALAALSKCVPAEELVTHLPFIRNLVASMVSDARYKKGGVGDGQFYLPGLNIPKGEHVLFKMNIYVNMTTLQTEPEVIFRALYNMEVLISLSDSDKLMFLIHH